MRISDWSSDVCSSDLRLARYERRMRRFLRFSGQSPSSPGLGRSSPCHWAWWCGGTGKRKVARAVTARKLLSSVAAQQPQAEPVLRIVPPLRNAQPRFGRQRNETGVGVLVAVLDLTRLARIKVDAPPFDGQDRQGVGKGKSV